MKLRRVRFYDKDGEQYRDGWFHCWSGLSEYPMAVVELSDGSCCRVSWEFVRFVTPYGAEKHEEA
jgi:hypothetical protein